MKSRWKIFSLVIWVRFVRVTSNWSVIRQKVESQNWCFKKTKHAKFSKKTNISYPLIRTLFYLFISVCFSEKPSGLWLAFIECYGLLTVQSSRGALFKGGALRNFTKFTGKHLCQSIFKRETLVQVFSSEFCKIFENIFFYRRPPVDCFCTKYIALNILYFTQKQNCHDNFSSITMIFSYIFFVFLFYFFGYLAKFDIYPCEVTNSCITKCNTSLVYMGLAKIIVEGHSIIT